MEEGDSAAMSGGERGIGRGRSTKVFASELPEGEVSLKLSGVDLDLDDSDGGLCRGSLVRGTRKRTSNDKRTIRKRSSILRSLSSSVRIYLETPGQGRVKTKCQRRLTRVECLFSVQLLR